MSAQIKIALRPRVGWLEQINLSKSVLLLCSRCRDFTESLNQKLP